MAIEAYCVKCRGKRIVEDAKEVTMKNGRLAAKGTCSHCGTEVFKFFPKRNRRA